MTEHWMIQTSIQNNYASKKAVIVEALIKMQKLFNNFAAKSSIF